MPLETHAFGFRLRANAPEGQKRFPISSNFVFKTLPQGIPLQGHQRWRTRREK
jgi:hypothetical protein